MSKREPLVLPGRFEREERRRPVESRAVSWAALRVLATDVVLTEADDADPRRLLLRPILRLAGAGLGVRTIADKMCLDSGVIEVALAEAADLGLLDDRGRLATDAFQRLSGSITDGGRTAIVVQDPASGSIVGASEALVAVFESGRRWAREELAQSSERWDLASRPPPVAMPPLSSIAVLQTERASILTRDGGSLRGHVTVLASRRWVRLLVPIAGRSGDRVIALNPFAERAVVHDQLSVAVTELAPGNFVSRLADLAIGRSLDLGLKPAIRASCEASLVSLVLASSDPDADRQGLVDAVVGVVRAIVDATALFGTETADDQLEVVGEPEVLRGTISGLARQVKWLDGRVDRVCEAVLLAARQRSTALGVVAMLLVAHALSGPATRGSANEILALASELDERLEQFVLDGDVACVLATLMKFARATGASREGNDAHV